MARQHSNQETIDYSVGLLAQAPESPERSICPPVVSPKTNSLSFIQAGNSGLSDRLRPSLQSPIRQARRPMINQPDDRIET